MNIIDKNKTEQIREPKINLTLKDNSKETLKWTIIGTVFIILNFIINNIIGFLNLINNIKEFN